KCAVESRAQRPGIVTAPGTNRFQCGDPDTSLVELAGEQAGDHRLADARIRASDEKNGMLHQPESEALFHVFDFDLNPAEQARQPIVDRSTNDEGDKAHD